MKTLKTFAAGCYSEVLLQEAVNDKTAGMAPKETGEKDGAGEKEAEELIDALPPAPSYHAGLGARFKYPGDPRKLREKSKMKLWKDYLKGASLGSC